MVTHWLLLAYCHLLSLAPARGYVREPFFASFLWLQKEGFFCFFLKLQKEMLFDSFWQQKEN
jgi:hypothetical protein